MTPRRRPLHAALAVALTLALGSTSCFDELPSPDTASESSSESGAGTATDSTSVDGMSSTSADGSGGTPESDGDDGSGGSEGSSSAGTEPCGRGCSPAAIPRAATPGSARAATAPARRSTPQVHVSLSNSRIAAAACG